MSIKFEEKEASVKPVKIEEPKLDYSKIVKELKEYFLNLKSVDKTQFKSTIELSKYHNSDFFKIEPQTYVSNLLKVVFLEVLEEEKDEAKKELKIAVLNNLLIALNTTLTDKSKDKSKVFCVFMAYVIGMLQQFDE
jgi:hypothetical protein